MEISIVGVLRDQIPFSLSRTKSQAGMLMIKARLWRVSNSLRNWAGVPVVGCPKSVGQIHLKVCGSSSVSTPRLPSRMADSIKIPSNWLPLMTALNQALATVPF